MTALLAEDDVYDCFDLETGFIAESGEELFVEGRLIGPADAPCYVVLGGISASRTVADTPDERGWWYCQAGPGAALDPRSVRILSLNFVTDSTSGFPTTGDQARAILALADSAGIETLRVIGSSYGGMVALALAILAPERVEKALVISAAHKPSAMARAWRSIQRETVELACRLGDGKAGLDLARRLAMTTYRTHAEIEDRFFEPDTETRDGAGIEAYLEARGMAFTEQTTPEAFLALSRSMDAHDVDTALITCPVTYVAVEEDRLVPIEQITAAAERTPKGQLDVISSYYGHDAFLKEEAEIDRIIRAFAG